MRFAWLIVPIISMAACGTTSMEESVGPAPTGSSTAGLITSRDDLRKLVPAPLTRDGEHVDTDAFAAVLSTASGDGILEYAVLCALPGDRTVQLGRRTLSGRLGLAPEWHTNDCDETCQRWVTACLLAHYSGDRAAFPIDLRADPLERSSSVFSFQVSAYFGNAFDPDASALRASLYACSGSGWAEPFEALSRDNAQLCNTADCLASYTGVCEATCASTEGDRYTDCRGTFDSERFDEVITVYIE